MLQAERDGAANQISVSERIFSGGTLSVRAVRGSSVRRRTKLRGRVLVRFVGKFRAERRSVVRRVIITGVSASRAACRFLIETHRRNHYTMSGFRNLSPLLVPRGTVVSPVALCVPRSDVSKALRGCTNWKQPPLDISVDAIDM